MGSKILWIIIVTVGMCLRAISAIAATDADVKKEVVKIEMYAITPDGDGGKLGFVMLQDSGKGLVITTDLSHLPPGAHGFHAHQVADCDAGVENGKKVAGFYAGDHYDPDKTGHHMGPENKGHRGDLPVLTVNANGDAKEVLVAPHLKLAEIKDRALVIHEGADNYSDDPKPNGGSGKRIACGTAD